MKINFNSMVELAQCVATDIWGSRDTIKIMEKLKEEVDELNEAIEANQDRPIEKFEVMKELGMFCSVYLG